MSKYISCKSCGTIYDAVKGNCPICGAVVPGQEKAVDDVQPEPAPVEQPKASPSPEAEDDVELFVSSLFADLEKSSFLDDGDDFVVPELTPNTHHAPQDAEEPTFSMDSTMKFDPAKLDELPPIPEETQESEDALLPPIITPRPRRPESDSPEARPASRTSGADRHHRDHRTEQAGPTPRPLRPQRPAGASHPTPRPAPKPTPVFDPAMFEEDEPPRAKARQEQPRRHLRQESKSSRDKIICLILATLVILLALFIGFRFLRPHLGLGEPKPTDPPVSIEPTDPPVRHCTALTVDKTLALTELGQTAQLTVVPVPADTTDLFTFVSDRTTVAQVSPEGVVTVVGEGTANITVICGNITAVCTVSCTLPTEPEPTETEPEPTETEPEPTETEPEPTETEPITLKLNKTDVTLRYEGESFTLKAGDYTALVTWRSDNTSIAKVDKNGKVTAVGPGTTKIHAILEGQDVYCIVRCRWTVEATEPAPTTPEPTTPTEPEPTTPEPTTPTEPTPTEPAPTDPTEPDPSNPASRKRRVSVV